PDELNAPLRKFLNKPAHAQSGILAQAGDLPASLLPVEQALPDGLTLIRSGEILGHAANTDQARALLNKHLNP
ncbi:MAG: hypothetical protein ACQKBY_00085, partial [Verrucomicrobiales bacterium]